MEKKENTKTKTQGGKKSQKRTTGSGKKKSRRKRTKYPALNNDFNLRSRWQYNDYDYIDELSESEKQWLNDFTEEYSNASVGKQSEAENNKFHRTKEMVKDCTDRNNARNRDLMNKNLRVNADLKSKWDMTHDKEGQQSNQVQAIEDLIDAKRKIEKKKAKE